MNIVAKPHEYSVKWLFKLRVKLIFVGYVLICYLKPSMNGCYLWLLHMDA